MRLLIATLLLTACAPGVTVYPGLHCTGRVNAGLLGGDALYSTFSAAAEELVEKCSPMIRVKIESWSGAE